MAPKIMSTLASTSLSRALGTCRTDRVYPRGRELERQDGDGDLDRAVDRGEPGRAANDRSARCGRHKGDRAAPPDTVSRSLGDGELCDRLGLEGLTQRDEVELDEAR
jgi:hypothetical protein